MTMTKSYERLIDMFICASEGYRRSKDKHDHSMTEGDAEQHKAEMRRRQPASTRCMTWRKRYSANPIKHSRTRSTK